MRIQAAISRTCSNLKKWFFKIRTSPVCKVRVVAAVGRLLEEHLDGPLEDGEADGKHVLRERHAARLLKGRVVQNQRERCSDHDRGEEERSNGIPPEPHVRAQRLRVREEEHGQDDDGARRRARGHNGVRHRVHVEPEPEEGGDEDAGHDARRDRHRDHAPQPCQRELQRALSGSELTLCHKRR